MKTKIILAFLCLCFTGAIYAQLPQIEGGAYFLEKAELVIQKLNSKEVLEHKILTDTASIEVDDMHLSNVIFEMEIENDKPLMCKLSDRKKYKFDELMVLRPELTDKELSELDERVLEEGYSFIGKELPPYELKMEGEKLIINFAKYSFAQSSITYTMTAELTLVMTKQK